MCFYRFIYNICSQLFFFRYHKVFRALVKVDEREKRIFNVKAVEGEKKTDEGEKMQSVILTTLYNCWKQHKQVF